MYQVNQDFLKGLLLALLHDIWGQVKEVNTSECGFIVILDYSISIKLLEEIRRVLGLFYKIGMLEVSIDEEHNRGLILECAIAGPGQNRFFIQP